MTNNDIGWRQSEWRQLQRGEEATDDVRRGLELLTISLEAFKLRGSDEADESCAIFIVSIEPVSWLCQHEVIMAVSEPSAAGEPPGPGTVQSRAVTQSTQTHIAASQRHTPAHQAGVNRKHRREGRYPCEWANEANSRWCRVGTTQEFDPPGS